MPVYWLVYFDIVHLAVVVLHLQVGDMMMPVILFCTVQSLLLLI